MPIIWPPGFAPDRVAARVSNEIAIAAPPEIVWAWLIRAADWPVWYPNSARVRIADGRTELSPHVRFTWQTFGVTVRSRVREFQAPQRIAWDAQAFLLDAYHAWLIEWRPGGCWVLTEEHQNGLTARAQAFFMPNRMYRGHALWLERLKAKAEAGAPP
ncbi:MAG TPA: SRPBCC domain-containing protein [Acetobacteraceae bacterium]|nr:SRPBCC domain-containing protein [Acetobacteraceae bacterium]